MSMFSCGSFNVGKRTAHMYHVQFRNGCAATVIAHTPDEALAELRYLEQELDLTEVQVHCIPDQRDVAIVYTDEGDIDELFDDYLGIERRLKPGFSLEVDEDGDKVVCGTVGAWCAALAEDAPHIIASSFADESESWRR